MKGRRVAGPSRPLTIATCQGRNSEVAGRAVVAYLTGRLGFPVHFVDDIPWQERERQLVWGDIDVGWICGSWYVLKRAVARYPVHLLVAPVMCGARYQDRPVYFSDVVVHRDSPYQSFADLAGAAWAYNEPHSYSGSYVMRCHLLRCSYPSDFFGRIVESGAHLRSLQLVAGRAVDTAAIDSTVLEFECTQQPTLCGELRTIAALGPNPMPPWVVCGDLSADLEQALRDCLLEMHRDVQGRATLAGTGLARFAAVTDADYDPIRETISSVAAHGEQLKCKSPVSPSSTPARAGSA